MRDPEQTLRDAIREAAVEALGLEAEAVGEIPLTWPPKPEMGDLASPVCFELAKVARRPPRHLGQLETDRRREVAHLGLRWPGQGDLADRLRFEAQGLDGGFTDRVAQSLFGVPHGGAL